jgi:hypothetical protein
MEEFVRGKEYGVAEKSLCFGVVVYAAAGGVYNYSIRMNTTNKVPRPNILSSALKVDLTSFNGYIKQGFIQTQNWLDNLILRI